VAQFKLPTANDNVLVVAEIGNNHDGSKDKAKLLIDIAADAGVDAVKFQTFRGLDIVSPLVTPSDYPQWQVGDFAYWHEFLDSIALPLEDHSEVFEYAISRGLHVFSTPTSPAIVDFLETINVPAYKIASMDVTNIPLLRKVAATGKPVIVSTGMANDFEIARLMDIFTLNQVALLHCISDYPLDPSNANLFSIQHLQNTYPNSQVVGFSDHSLDAELSCLAVALGAKIIEKHITYDRSSPTPAEHHFSLDPIMLKKFVASIRTTESSLGTIGLNRSQGEKTNRLKYRRSIHINKTLDVGHVIKSDDIEIVRPGDGAGPECVDDIVGSTLVNKKFAWDPLDENDLLKR